MANAVLSYTLLFFYFVTMEKEKKGVGLFAGWGGRFEWGRVGEIEGMGMLGKLTSGVQLGGGGGGGGL